MKFFFKIIVFHYLMLFVLDNGLMASNKKIKNYPKINGVQVFVLDPKYKDDISSFFKDARAKGVNTVFFRVFHNQSDRPHLGLNIACSNGVYFKTTETCTVYNLLPQILDVAHKENIKVFAWMATRSLTYLKSDDNISKAFAPDGNIINGYGANIFKESVNNSIIKIFNDLAKYDIDGILLQDDFIVKYNEGADKETVALFNKETGFTSSTSSFFGSIKEFNGKKIFSGYKDTFYIWSLWKNAHLMYLFKKIETSIKKTNPKLLIAANVYYETPSDIDMALAWYAQSIKSLINAGADYFAVMGYAEQISNEKQLNKDETTLYINGVAKKSMQHINNYGRILIKLQNAPFNKGDSFVNHDYSKEVCKSLKSLGDFGIIQVPVNKAEDIVSECL